MSTKVAQSPEMSRYETRRKRYLGLGLAGAAVAAIGTTFMLMGQKKGQPQSASRAAAGVGGVLAVVSAVGYLFQRRPASTAKKPEATQPAPTPAVPPASAPQANLLWLMTHPEMHPAPLPQLQEAEEQQIVIGEDQPPETTEVEPEAAVEGQLAMVEPQAQLADFPAEGQQIPMAQQPTVNAQPAAQEGEPEAAAELSDSDDREPGQEAHRSPLGSPRSVKVEVQLDPAPAADAPPRSPLANAAATQPQPMVVEEQPVEAVQPDPVPAEAQPAAAPAAAVVQQPAPAGSWTQRLRAWFNTEDAPRPQTELGYLDDASIRFRG